MRIVFYSTNSNNYRKGSVVFGMNPNCFQQFECLRKKFPEYEFFVVAEPPAMFLLDEESIEEKSTSGEEIEVFAQRILDLSPDMAIAVTYWTQPFDWMGIKDSLVGEFLEGKGVRTIYHPVRTSEICFDKWQTHQFLEENGFNCAKGVYVHHQMFWAERNRNMVVQNVYREAIFSSIKKLKFPVVIKDVYGLSSYGMYVVQTFEQAKCLLLSRKNNGDRIVEEFLSGNSYGLEIYGSEGTYVVTPPLINSVNQFVQAHPHATCHRLRHPADSRIDFYHEPLFSVKKQVNLRNSIKMKQTCQPPHFVLQLRQAEFFRWLTHNRSKLYILFWTCKAKLINRIYKYRRDGIISLMTINFNAKRKTF